MKVAGIVSGAPSRGAGSPGREKDFPRSCFGFCVLPACFSQIRAAPTFFSFEVSFQTSFPGAARFGTTAINWQLIKL